MVEVGPFLAYLLSQTVKALPLTFDSFLNILNFSEEYLIRICENQQCRSLFLTRSKFKPAGSLRTCCAEKRQGPSLPHPLYIGVAGSSCFNPLPLALDYIAFKLALAYSKNVY